MRVRNRTGIPQIAPGGSLFPPGIWCSVPGEVSWPDAIWMHTQRMGDLIGIHDSEDLLWKSNNGTHLYWLSPFSVGDGYATAAENLVHALKGQGCQIEIHQCWFREDYGLRPETLEMLRRPVQGVHRVGICMATPGEFKKLPTPYRIGLTMYEADDPLANNPEWSHDCQEVDMLIVPCEYCKGVFAEFARVPIHVTPLAIHPIYFSAQERKPKDVFKFVMYGTLTGRKAPLETLDAFRKAFPKNKYPDVRIEFKTRLKYFGWAEGQLPDIADDPRISIISDNWLPQQMFDWLLDADVMVYPSKGEGFGMPVREAIATGLPTILSNHTGHTELCKKRYAWPIPTDSIEASPLGGNWRIPNWDYLISTMRWMYNNREKAYKKGYADSQSFAREYNTEVVGKKLLDIIEGVTPERSRVRHSRIPAILKETAADHIEFLDWFTNIVPKPGPIWDMGVGEGLLAQELISRGYEVLGVVEGAEREGVIKKLQARDINICLVVYTSGDYLAPVLRRHRLQRPAACVSMGVLQQLGDKEIVSLIRTQLAISPLVFFSAPSVFYPEFYNHGARMMRNKRWLDILSPFSCDMKLYGNERFLMVQVRETVLAPGVVQRKHGRILQGIWHENR